MDPMLTRIKRAWGKRGWADFQQWMVDESFKFRERHEEKEEAIRTHIRKSQPWRIRFLDEDVNKSMAPISEALDAEYKATVRREFEERLVWSGQFNADWAHASEAERELIIGQLVTEPPDADTQEYIERGYEARNQQTLAPRALPSDFDIQTRPDTKGRRERLFSRMRRGRSQSRGRSPERVARSQDPVPVPVPVPEIWYPSGYTGPIRGRTVVAPSGSRVGMTTPPPSYTLDATQDNLAHMLYSTINEERGIRADDPNLRRVFERAERKFRQAAQEFERDIVHAV